MVDILIRGIPNIPEYVIAAVDGNGTGGGDGFEYICVGCPAGGTGDATALIESKPRAECRFNTGSAVFCAELKANQFWV